MLNLKIKNFTPIQDNFLGNGVVYHGYAGMPDANGRVYSEEQCALEAKRAADMRLKLVRTKYDWWAWDENTNTWNWENDKMRPFYRWLQRLKDANIDVSLNTGWNSPGDILSNTWSGISPFTVEGDWEASIKKFGDWVSETVHQIVELRGFTNVKYLTLFTEPQHFDSNGEPMCKEHTPYTCWYDATQAAHDALVRDGRRHLVKIMGPNEGATDTSDMLKWVAERNPDFVDIYSSHNYLSVEPAPYENVKKGLGGVFTTTCGGRIMQPVELEANTEYTCSINFDVLKNQNDSEGSIDGRLLFGVFEHSETNDLFDDSEVKSPRSCVTENSLYNIAGDLIVDGENTYTFKFKTTEQTKGLLGVFFDIRNDVKNRVFSLTLVDENENHIEKNPTFLNNSQGWRGCYADGIDSPYHAWINWTKTGMQYVPKGKGFCFDEYNTLYDRDNSRIEHGSDIVTAAVAFMNSGAQTSLIWTIFDQIWPNSNATSWDSFFNGEHRCGVMPTLFRSLVPHLSYYAFGLLSRYVTGEGTKVYEGDCVLRTATTMSVSPDGDITIVVVNNKPEEENFTISFDKALDNIKFNRHTFNPQICIPDEKAEMIGIDKITEPITKTLTDNIAPFGVTVYTTMKD